METRNQLTINGSKLKALIYGNELVPTYVSEELGHDKGYLGKCFLRNKISKASAIALENMYGIKIDQYQKNIEIDADNVLTADEIKEIIFTNYKTMTNLANSIGRSVSHVSDWLNGNRPLNPTDKFNIACALGIDKSRIPDMFSKEEVVEESPTIENKERNLNEGINSLEKTFRRLESNLNGLGSLLSQMIDNQNKIIENQAKEINYLAHVYKNTKHFETFDETMARVKAASMTMTVKEGDKQ